MVSGRHVRNTRQDADRPMAIAADLMMESSFRRFYLRWLAACWLPALILMLPFAAVAVAFWLRLTPLFRVGFVVGQLAVPLFWLLVAVGQWWFMRGRTHPLADVGQRPLRSRGSWPRSCSSWRAA